MDTLLHVMGDAFLDTNRILLLERLASLTGLDRAILGSSGSDGVEAAPKTARIRADETKSWRSRAATMASATRVAGHGVQRRRLPSTLPSPTRRPRAARGVRGDPARYERHRRSLGEPVAPRGIRVPPAGGCKPLLTRRAAGAVLIFDEVYTGFGRTGDWFAFQHEAVRPDILVLGKGMAGGFPISAAVGTAEAMDAWGASKGFALHTQTFLGHPVGCAMALATIALLEDVIPTVNPTSAWVRGLLEERGYTVRGRGLMLGIELENTWR